MPQNRLIQATDLTRRDPRTDRLLLDRVNLSISEGERIGLVGPSGSGKSSLLRAIAKLDPCDQGEVRYRGQVIAEDAVPPFRRQVIYLPQRPAFVASSVRENLCLPFRLAVSDESPDDERFNQWMEALGRSPDLLDQSVEKLSGGEQQIVALIRALALSPQVLLLDEPSASLDAESTKCFEQAVERWHGATDAGNASRSLIWTSHDANQVRRMTDRIVRMQAGALSEGSDNE